MIPAEDHRLLAVPNVSDGSEQGVIEQLRESFAATGVALLDEHSDPIHDRTVYTLAGENGTFLRALEGLARAAVERIDINRQHGAHPRIGSLDVCPIVYPDPAERLRARELALAAGERLGSLGLPVFLYGELATSHERAERAFFRTGGHVELERRMRAGDLKPDFGPARPHPTAGGVLVTARPPLAAFNVLLAPGASMDDGRAVAASVRESGGGLPGVRAIAIAMEEDRVQISTNVHDPIAVPLAEVVATISRHAEARQTRPVEAELVGLVPEAALAGYPEDEVPFQGGPVRERTVEAQLLAHRDGG